MKRPSADTKAAVLRDYAAGMAGTTAAEKWGVSPSTAHKWILKAGISRSNGESLRIRAQRRRDSEFGLPEGRWVPNHRGIQVWEAA